MFYLNYNVYIYFIFFFFQAEDGIRDLTVTGVQTCALPISLRDWPRDQSLSIGSTLRGRWPRARNSSSWRNQRRVRGSCTGRNRKVTGPRTSTQRTSCPHWERRHPCRQFLRQSRELAGKDAGAPSKIHGEPNHFVVNNWTSAASFSGPVMKSSERK